MNLLKDSQNGDGIHSRDETAKGHTLQEIDGCISTYKNSESETLTFKSQQFPKAYIYIDRCCRILQVYGNVSH